MFVGAYWNAREEARLQCAVRVSKALQTIGKIDLQFSSWHLKSRSKSSSSTSVGMSSDEIAAILRSNNRDTDNTAISELGFNIGLWNGSEQFPCSFSVTCGGYSEFVKNSAVLQLPSGKIRDEELPHEWVRKILECMISAFEPDNGVVTSNEFLDHAGGGAPWESGGWLVYDRTTGVVEEKGTLGVVH